MKKELYFNMNCLQKDEKSGLISTTCVLSETNEIESYSQINELYENGMIVMSSVPYDTNPIEEERKVTKKESLRTSIEQLLIDEGIENTKTKLERIYNEDIEVSIYLQYDETITDEEIDYVKNEIEKNQYINDSIIYKRVSKEITKVSFLQNDNLIIFF